MPDHEQLSPRTFGNQSRLPKLPVPDLHDTCAKLLEWVAPLLDHNQLARTRELVAEFTRPGGDGEKLQQALQEWAGQEGMGNWLEPFWTDKYLRYRGPVCFHSNVGLVVRSITGTEEQSQTRFAARVVCSALRFKDLIDREEIPVALEQGSPLCMDPLKNLFAVTRIPERDVDQLRGSFLGSPIPPEAARHILVLRRGRFFALEVLSESGESYPEADIAQGLESILDVAALPPNHPMGETVGSLTAMERNAWANARAELLELDPANRTVLDTLETALFALSLDEASPDTPEGHAEAIMAGEAGNRWFDKSLQLIVCANNRFGLCFEHSSLDATPILGLLDFIQGELSLPTNPATPPKGGRIKPKTLNFILNDALKRTIQKAGEDFEALRLDTKTQGLEFRKFGKDQIKTLGASPDAFVQLAFQTAQFQVFGRCGSTYESAMVRRFLHGRTESLRSVSTESVRFVMAMTSTELDDTSKAAALRDALGQQVKRMKECKAGLGVERHLFGLLSIYRRSGRALGLTTEPALFSDAGPRLLGHDTLSTSNCGSSAVRMMIFGPVVDDGFGIGYALTEDHIDFMVTSRGALENELHRFVEYLDNSILEMARLLGR